MMRPLLMYQHRLQYGLRHVVETVQRNIEYPVPVFFRHEHQYIVTTDAGIVHQNFNVFFRVTGFPRLNGFCNLLTLAYIEHQYLTVLSLLMYQLQCPLSFGYIAYIVDKDVIAHPGQFDADRTAYPAAASSY